MSAVALKWHVIVDYGFKLGHGFNRGYYRFVAQEEASEKPKIYTAPDKQAVQ